MSLYGPPPNLALDEAIYTIFKHYSTSWKSDIGNTFSGMTKDTEAQVLAFAMDNVAFAKLCREAPGLAQCIGRTEVDLIFSTAKPLGERRLDYEHFLQAILQLAMKIYPDDDPTIALANFLARFLFALFDQPPATVSMNVVEKVYKGLLLDSASASASSSEAQPKRS